MDELMGIRMAKRTIEYDDEDLHVALFDVIQETMADEIRKMVRLRAQAAIDKAIEAEIDPLVMAALTGEKFGTRGYRGYLHQQDLTGIVKNAVVSYLDARVYNYNPKSDRASEMVHDSSDSHSSGPTRLECFLRHCIEQHINQHIADKMGAVAKEFIRERGDLEKVAREQMAALLKDRFNL